jgi:ribonuclease J
MVDESGNPVSDDLVEERRTLAGEGFVVVRVVVDGRKGRLVGEPFVETRGWVEPSEHDSWCREVAEAVSGALKPVVAEGERDSKELARLARRATGRLVSRRTGRRPALVPVVEVR